MYQDNPIGIAIGKIRLQQGITQKMLSEGLCSNVTLSRIESGLYAVDKMLSDTLLQRLGQSPDKFEYLLDNQDYVLYQMRKKIADAFMAGNFSSMQEDMQKYRKKIEQDAKCKNKNKAEYSFHVQFLLQSEALIMRAKHQEPAQVIEKVMEAIQMTVPSFLKKPLVSCLLSITELSLVQLLSNCYLENNQNNQAITLMEEIIENLDIRYIDEEEKLKLYPYAGYSLAKLYFEHKEYKLLLSLCDKELSLLANNLTITYVPEFLDIKNKAYECLLALGDTTYEYPNYETVKQQIKDIYELYDEFGSPEQINDTFHNCYPDWNFSKEIYLAAENITLKRRAYGLTQLKLSEKVCSWENISRIETTEQVPTRTIYLKLMEELDADYIDASPFIIMEDFSFQEKRRLFEKLIVNQDYISAELLLDELEKNSESENLTNKQYLLRAKANINYRQGKISANEYLERLEEAILITIPKYGSINLALWPLRRREAIILNNIATVYADLDNFEKTFEILEQVKLRYETSQVGITNHVIGYTLTLYNLSNYLYRYGKYQEALTLAKTGIQICLKCGRAYPVSYMLLIMAYCLESFSEIKTINYKVDKNYCIKYYHKMFALDLFFVNSFHELVLEHYKEKYHRTKLDYPEFLF